MTTGHLVPLGNGSMGHSVTGALGCLALGCSASRPCNPSYFDFVKYVKHCTEILTNTLLFIQICLSIENNNKLHHEAPKLPLVNELGIDKGAQLIRQLHWLKSLIYGSTYLIKNCLFGFSPMFRGLKDRICILPKDNNRRVRGLVERKKGLAQI